MTSEWGLRTILHGTVLCKSKLPQQPTADFVNCWSLQLLDKFSAVESWVTKWSWRNSILLRGSSIPTELQSSSNCRLLSVFSMQRANAKGLALLTTSFSSETSSRVHKAKISHLVASRVHFATLTGFRARLNLQFPTVTYNHKSPLLWSKKTRKVWNCWSEITWLYYW